MNNDHILYIHIIYLTSGYINVHVFNKRVVYAHVLNHKVIKVTVDITTMGQVITDILLTS